MANSSSILNAQQQAALSDWSKNMRACESQLSKLITTMAALNATYNAVGGASALLALIQATDVVDDGNGLSGSLPMTKQNLIDRVADIQTLLTTYNTTTYKSLWAQACGSTNL
jgi:hypothetical protein